jgi:hypothetical protein
LPIEHDDNTTRAVARLPGLDIAIEHRRLDDAERISIHLQAAPSFAAFGEALDIANPFAFWTRAAQLAFLPWLAWSPWLGASRALLPPVASEAPPTAPEA